MELRDGQLTVSGEKKSSHEERGRNYYFSERAYGRFSRSFRLPANADQESVKAEYKDGVLTIRIGMVVSTDASARKIAVERG